MLLVQSARLRPRDVPLPRRYARRPQPFPAENGRLVEVDELRVVREVERRERERQAAAEKQRGREPLATEARELLDDTRERQLGEVETAVEIRIVVPAVSLVRPRKPERAVQAVRLRTLVPREAAVEDQAKESDRSARMARISSSVRPS